VISRIINVICSQMSVTYVTTGARLWEKRLPNIPLQFHTVTLFHFDNYVLGNLPHMLSSFAVRE